MNTPVDNFLSVQSNSSKARGGVYSDTTLSSASLLKPQTFPQHVDITID